MTPVTTKRPPYQFTIRRLLFLSTAVAVCMASARSFDVPPMIQAILGVYFSLFVIGAVMRWPAIRAKQREIWQRRQKILEERATMVADANRTRPSSSIESSDNNES